MSSQMPKLELLDARNATGAYAGASSVGYGDHISDLPFLAACDEGVLVEPVPGLELADATAPPPPPEVVKNAELEEGEEGSMEWWF